MQSDVVQRGFGRCKFRYGHLADLNSLYNFGHYKPLCRNDLYTKKKRKKNKQKNP